MTGACDSGRLRRCLRLCSLTVWRTVLSGNRDRSPSGLSSSTVKEVGVVENAMNVALEASQIGRVRGGVHLMRLNGKSQGLEAEKQPDARIMSPGATGEERSLQARQIWLKIEGKRRAVELRRETARDERREEDGLARVDGFRRGKDHGGVGWNERRNGKQEESQEVQESLGVVGGERTWDGRIG